MLALGISACSNKQNSNPEIDFSETKDIVDGNLEDESEAIYIAIASMTSPKETLTYYQDLIKYMSEQIGRPIYIKQKLSNRLSNHWPPPHHRIISI